MDAGHMGFTGLAKAIPPAFAAFLFGQVVRHVLRSRFGLQVRSYDEALCDMPRARRELRHWRRGAGGVSDRQGVEFSLAPPPMAAPLPVAGTDRGGTDPTFLDHGTTRVVQLTRVAVREIDLSFAGGFDRFVAPYGTHDWLSELRPIRRRGRQVRQARCISLWRLTTGPDALLAHVCDGLLATWGLGL